MRIITGLVLIGLMSGCAVVDIYKVDETAALSYEVVTVGSDPHSYAHPEDAVVRHLDLELKVDFEKKELAGKAELTIENLTGTKRLYLDTRGLTIESVSRDGGGETTSWFVHKEEKGQAGASE